MEIPNSGRTAVNNATGSSLADRARTCCPWRDHVFETTSSETLHTGKIFALRLDQVRMPGGKIVSGRSSSTTARWRCVAIDDDGRIPMVHQYRHPFGRRLWELPAGLLDVSGEAPHLTAARELREEAGLAAQTWQVLVDLDSTPGFSDESVRVYLATGLTQVDRPEAHDEEADMTLQWYPIDEAFGRVFSGEIVNALAVAGILAAYAVRNGRAAAAAGGRAVDRTSRRRSAARRGRRPSDHGGRSLAVWRSNPSCRVSRSSDDRAGRRGQYLELLSPRPAPLLRASRARGIDDLAKVSEDDVSEFLVALRRGDPDSGVVAAVGGVGGTDPDRGARPAPVRRRRGPGRNRRRAGRQAADAGPSAAQKPELDQVLALLAGAGGDSPSDGPLTLRNRALLELLYSTGARISEAVGLDVDDIDTHARSVLLRGKGGKQRLVPIGRPARAGAGRLPGARTFRVGAPRPRHPGASSSMPAVAGCRGRARGRCCRTRPSGPDHRGCVPAHAAAFVCDPPARGRRRRPGGAGAARTRLGHHDPDLHDGHRARAARSLGRSPPAGPLSSAPAVGVARYSDSSTKSGISSDTPRASCARWCSTACPAADACIRGISAHPAP